MFGRPRPAGARVRRAPRDLCAAYFLCIGLAIQGGVASGASLGDVPGSAPESVRDVLWRGWLQGRWSDEVVVRELVGVGPQAIPALFELYSGQDSAIWENAPEGSMDFARGPEQGARLAGQALLELPPGSVLEHVQRSRSLASEAGRLAGFELLCTLGAEDELAACLAVVASFPEEQLRAPALRQRLPEGLRRLFQRVPQAALAAANALDDLPDSHHGLVIDALLAIDHPVALEVLPIVMERFESDYPRVLARLGELGESYPWRLSTDDGFLVRAHLETDDWSVRRAACVLAANWHALDSFEELVRLAEEDPQPAVRRAAHWALHELSHTELDLDGAGWQRWYGVQNELWERESPGLLIDLSSDDPTLVSRALRGLARFPLHRHLSAPRIASVLFVHPRLAQTVSAVLLELNSNLAVPTLVSVLEVSSSDRARQVAWMTLKRLTGRELDMDDPSWTALAIQ